MQYEDFDYVIGETRPGSRLGAISVFREIYENTRIRQRKGRLVRRASDPRVGKPPRAPVQTDDRFEIRDFAAILDDFRVDLEDLYCKMELHDELVQSFETLG